MKEILWQSESRQLQIATRTLKPTDLFQEILQTQRRSGIIKANRRATTVIHPS